MPDEQTSEPKPETKTLRGIIVDVQFGIVAAVVAERDRILNFPFQYVFIREHNGGEHVLVHPGNGAWWKGEDVRLEYEPSSFGVVKEEAIIAHARCCTGPWSADYRTRPHDIESMGDIRAEGIIMDLEYAITVGKPGGK